MIVTEFFKGMFTAEGTKEFENISPNNMRAKFTEVKKRQAVKCLKNKKSIGIDNIREEHLKNGPAIVFQKTAAILNQIAETGEYPRIIVPL